VFAAFFGEIKMNIVLASMMATGSLISIDFLLS